MITIEDTGASLRGDHRSDPISSRVKFFYDIGVRVLQLMHYRINEIGDIQTEDPRHKGLTAFGRDVVKEMNKLGMVIDVAHCIVGYLERRSRGKPTPDHLLSYRRLCFTRPTRVTSRTKT